MDKTIALFMSFVISLASTHENDEKLIKWIKI